MSNGILPPLGRNGIVNAVRRLSNMPVTGWREVDPAATFVAGQMAKLATVNGKVMVQTVSATSDKVVGMFFTNNTTYFYRTVVLEEHTFGENVSAPNIVYVKPYVKAASYVVYADDQTTPKTETTDYTIDVTSGAITRVAIGATDTVYVTYQYKDVDLSGINQVVGSGKAALLEEIGEVATTTYDTTSATAYTLGANIYKNATGYLTATSAGSAIGFITKAPTADDPELHVKLNLV
jgi:hypothetical protein